MVLLHRKLYLPGIQMGPTFPRGSNFFQRGGGGGGGVQMLISIETHITCDSKGGLDSQSPLWIRTCMWS